MAELLRLLDITGLRPQVLIGKDIHTDVSSQVCTFCRWCSFLEAECIRARSFMRLKRAPTIS